MIDRNAQVTESNEYLRANFIYQHATNATNNMLITTNNLKIIISKTKLFANNLIFTTNNSILFCPRTRAFLLLLGIT